MLTNSRSVRNNPMNDASKYPKEGQESPTFNNISLEPPKISPRKIKSENQSAQKLPRFTLQQIKSKANSIAIDFVKNKLKIKTFTEGIFSGLQQIRQSSNLSSFFELLFGFVGDTVRQTVSNTSQDPQKQLVVVIRSKQCKKLRIVRQQDLQKRKRSKSLKDLQIAEKANEQMKIQLFNVKEANNSLQKKIATLLQRYKEKKQFYLTEIRKLTQIISTSSKDMRNLTLMKTKQAKSMEESHVKTVSRQSSQVKIDISSLSGIRETNYNQRAKNISTPPKNKMLNSHPTANTTNLKGLSSISSVQHLEQQSY